MPEALSVEGTEKEESAESMPLAFFCAVLAFPALAFVGREASSSFSRASFSAFLRAASAALAAAASL